MAGCGGGGVGGGGEVLSCSLPLLRAPEEIVLPSLAVNSGRSRTRSQGLGP